MIYAACFTLITLVCIYFLLVWQIKEIVKDELIKEKESSAQKNEIKREKIREKRKKLLQLRHKQILQNQNNQQNQQQIQEQSIDTFDYPSSNMSDFTSDMDSYVDPVEGYNGQKDNGNNTGHASGYSGNRLDKNDIMARDIADGLR